VASVTELSAPYGNFLLQPRRGPGVCELCFNLTAGYRHCYACTQNASWLDAYVPISYSIGREQLHHALRTYKRLDNDIGRRFCIDLAAILWRFLQAHEACVARQAGAEHFELVTTVPSRDPQRRLETIVSQVVAPTAARHEVLLARRADPPAHHFDPQKFGAVRRLKSASVLLIDDTWTTGASAQSAAAALKQAGAQTVAAVTIGRHLNRAWHENDRRLRSITRPFDWDRCVLCETSD
jgi:predicted amidophosphoribosyltransferase